MQEPAMVELSADNKSLQPGSYVAGRSTGARAGQLGDMGQPGLVYKPSISHLPLILNTLPERMAVARADQTCA